MKKRLLLLLLLPPLSPPAAASTLFRCADEHGQVLYTNQKSAGRNCSVLSTEEKNEKNPPGRKDNSGAARSDITTGTAFFVNPSIAITNHHVVDDCKTIYLGNKRNLVGAVLARDKSNDLAALSVSDPSVHLGISLSSRGPSLGEEVMVLGYPLGNLLGGELTVTTGTISSFPRIREKSLLQLTAPIQPGNSGGPIVDRSGGVLGVVVGSLNGIALARLTGSIPQNVNFGIHLEKMKRFLDAKNIQYTSDSSSNKPLTSSQVVTNIRDAILPVQCVR